MNDPIFDMIETFKTVVIDPQNPHHYENEHDDRSVCYSCSNCKSCYLLHRWYQYCPICGFKIKWFPHLVVIHVKNGKIMTYDSEDANGKYRPKVELRYECPKCGDDNIEADFEKGKYEEKCPCCNAEIIWIF